MKKIIYYLLVILTISISACKKDESSLQDEPTSGTSTKISVMGIVENEFGQPIYGATVTIGDKQFNSDGNGVFFINNVSVPTKRAVALVSKTGYWDKQYAFIPSSNTQHYCKLIMPIKQFNYSVSGAAGGTINVGTATVAFQSNSFVNSNGTPYNGTVQIAARHLPVSDPNLKALIPGRDLLAEDLAGDEKLLITYGMIGVELQASNGDKLQLASGKNATITMPIDASQQAAAPATIPLWYFDTTKNLWKEEGAATKQGNNYVGQVAHFSWWNYDVPTNFIQLNGSIKYNNGAPAPYIEILADGVSGYEFSNGNGDFDFLVPVQAQIDFTAYSDVIGQSPIVTYSGSTTNTDIADLILPAFNNGLLETNFIDCFGSPTSGTLWFQNDSSGNVYMTSGYTTSNISTYTEIGQTSYKAYSSNGSIISGSININPYPAVTTIPTIQFCSPGWNLNHEYYTLDLFPDTNGCFPTLHIEDTLSTVSLSAGSNNVNLYLLDADSNVSDTSVVINGIFDMLPGYQLFDTTSVQYLNFQINYNNSTFYISSDYGYLNIKSTGYVIGDYVELEYFGFASITVPGNPICFKEISFRTRFRRR